MITVFPGIFRNPGYLIISQPDPGIKNAKIRPASFQKNEDKDLSVWGRPGTRWIIFSFDLGY
jgi:hypothetical protein